MLEFFTVVVMAAHLVCVNVASAGPLVAVWLDWREWRGDPLAGRCGRRLAWYAVWLFLWGGALGLLLGLLVWDPPFRDALSQLPSKIHYGLWELLFSLALMVAVAAWWTRVPASRTAGRSLRTVLQVLASTNLLYHFPFLFVVVSDLAGGTVTVEGTIDAAGFRALMSAPSVWARVIHFWFASLAVTGMALIADAAWRERRGEFSGEETGRVTRWGARWALAATVVQLPIGVWLVAALPAAMQQRVLGSDAVGSGLLMLSILAVLWLLHQLADLAWGAGDRASRTRALLTMLAVVVMMTGVLQRLTAR